MTKLAERERFWEREQNGKWGLDEYRFCGGWTATAGAIAYTIATKGTEDEDGEYHQPEPFLAGMMFMAALIAIAYNHIKRQEARKKIAEEVLKEIRAERIKTNDWTY